MTCRARGLISRAAVLIVVAGLAIHVWEGGGTAAAVATVACGDSERDARRAATMAAACGRSVEDLSGRSPTARTLARPDGNRELVEYAQPQWVRRADGSWDSIDTSLRHEGAAVKPVATTVPTEFSGGGDAALARLTSGAGMLAMTWTQPLPKPVLSGDTATYPEVLPGVDLRLTATPTGFEQVFVVKTRRAADNPALAAVRFGLSTAGLSVSAVKGGGLEARDASGAPVFTSPPALMWDSTGEAATGPGGLARSAVMGEHLDAGGVTVVPDRAFLTDPRTRYPVFLDPSWAGGVSGNVWKVVADRSDLVNSSTFVMNNGAAKGDAGSGRTCDEFSGNTCLSPQYRVRSFVRMDINGARGKHVLAATFNITQKWAWTCAPASPAKLWVTSAISSATTWNTQPNFRDDLVATANASFRAGGGAGCGDTGTVSFNAKTMVDTAYASGWGDLTLGLRAMDEGATAQWKRFDHNSAALSIVYNTVPNLPDTQSTHGQACATGSGRPVVAVTTPVLSARVSDPDGATGGDIGSVLRGEFEWERFDAATSTWTAAGSATGTPQSGGVTSPSPAPAFSTGSVYRWRVRAGDSWSYGGTSGKDTSGWTGWCELEVDAVAPSAPQAAADPANQPFAAGRTVRLTLAAGGSPADTDLTGFQWWVVDGAGTHAPSFAAGTSATIAWTPIAGQGTIHVKAKDRIQLSAAETTYAFNAAQAATEVARWPLTDPAGSTGAADVTGHGHNAFANLQGDSRFGAPGRTVNGDSALYMNGATDTDLRLDGPVLDTSRNFTVAAWVKLDDNSETREILTIAGTNFGAVYVQYDRPYDRWVVGSPSADVPNPQWDAARSRTVPKLGVWTHVTAVYDAAAPSLSIYVDGTLETTLTGRTLFAGAGRLWIGRSQGGAHWTGSLSDIRLWDRALGAAEIAAVVDPTQPAANLNVARWLMNEGSGGTAFDSSDYFHDLNLTLEPGVTWTAGGQQGSALSFAGNGAARSIDPTTGSPGPVLHTDQSMTVSAWVRLDTMPAWNFTAVGQSGERVSGFYLGVRQFGQGFKWSFSLPDVDSESSAGWVHAAAPAALTAADLGTWVHLVGVYDAVSGAVSLYVNGTLAGTTTRTAAGWNATGPLTVGGAQWTDAGGSTPTRLINFWHGAIDTVTVYQGAVPAASVATIP
ncbi:LamG-like jellyroll fold domain-containing protein [Dactylosporangium sp. NPDC051541]|uniref:LamG-like jellyroll fold domain-containing protein n=1 Tax=Dactylosporangium sp. NPDC051541 TaxID=3363977 RepID=UPI00379FD100